MILRLLIFLQLTAEIFSADVELICTYDAPSVPYNDVTYQFKRCVVGVFSAPRKTKITAVTAGQFTNDSIDYIHADGKTIKYFPQGLEEIFPNLNYIYIHNSKLLEISKNDLKPFTKLRFLFLQTNFIEYLQPYLFENNPDVEYINFYNNKISFIDPMAFEGLFYLETLDLRTNTCVNTLTYRQLAVTNAITAAANACKATALKERFDKRDKFLNTENHNSAIEALWSANMTSQISELKAELEAIRNECGNYRKKCHELNEIINVN